MLTLDDLDHFSNPNMTPRLAAAAIEPDGVALARLTRIVACLSFCNDVANEELAEGGLIAARRALKSVIRAQQRNRRLDGDELGRALEGVLRSLGEQARRRGEPPEAAAERHAVEAEIQGVADDLIGEPTQDAALLGALARGEFELLPSSELAPLADSLGRFNGSATVDLDLAVDDAGPVQLVRVRLVVESGFWRWSAGEGSCMSRGGAPAVFLEPHDALVRALLAGISLRSGRAIGAWADAVCEQPLAGVEVAEAHVA